MTTPPPAQPEPHRLRRVAASFGSDSERYDRARPRYPDALVDRIVAASPGPDVLDVGTGTGIVAEQFRAAGCRVLGVDVDDRMAGVARRRGLTVEVAAFETWDPAGRTFDAVVSGQTWHWIDPVVAAARAADVLRPGGRLAVFWNVFLPAPEVAAGFAAVHRRVLPDAPGSVWAGSVLDAYSVLFARAADGMGQDGRFGESEQWRVDWQRSYTRGEWLDQVPTFGGAGDLPPDRLQQLLDGLGDAIDGWGGSFTMAYAAVAVTAVRTGPSTLSPGPAAPA